MPTALSEILDDVRSRLDESSATFWTDDQLTRWINEGVRDIARRTETLEIVDDSTIAVVSGTSKVALPAAVQRVHRVEWQPTGQFQRYPLELATYYAMDAIWGTQQLQQRSYPAYAVIWGRPPALSMQLFPVPSSDGVLVLYYYALPTPMGSSSDQADLSEGWQDLVALYCEYVALRKDRDPRWQESKNLYEQGLHDLVDVSRQHHDQATTINRGAAGYFGYGNSFGGWW